MSIDLTFVAQIIVFITMITLLWKMLYGPLNNLMEARTQKIAEGLAAAEAGIEAKAVAEVEIARQIEEARKKAHEIVVAAEKRAAEINEEALNKARNEAERILDAAKEEVGAEVERARVALRKEVGNIAMLAASKVIEAELDASRHGKLIDGIVAKGFGNA
jgi:F-type H+-transporting ATPase subunit b